MIKKIGSWLAKRAEKRSIYAGIVIIASMLGAGKFGLQINQIGQAVGLIVGGGLLAHASND